MNDVPHLPFDAPPEPTPPPAGRRPRARRNAQDTRDGRRRLLIWALSIMLGVLVVNALVGENGYLSTVRNERQERALKAEVARLRLENQQLQVASRRLVSDPSALDETARRDLDLIKPGETLVIIHDSKPAASGPASPASPGLTTDR